METAGVWSVTGAFPGARPPVQTEAQPGHVRAAHAASFFARRRDAAAIEPTPAIQAGQRERSSCPIPDLGRNGCDQRRAAVGRGMATVIMTVRNASTRLPASAGGQPEIYEEGMYDRCDERLDTADRHRIRRAKSVYYRERNGRSGQGLLLSIARIWSTPPPVSCGCK